MSTIKKIFIRTNMGPFRTPTSALMRLNAHDATETYTLPPSGTKGLSVRVLGEISFNVVVITFLQ